MTVIKRPWNEIGRSFEHRLPSTSRTKFSSVCSYELSDRSFWFYKWPYNFARWSTWRKRCHYTYLWYFASKCEKVEFELGAMIQFLLTICWWFKTVLCPKYSVKWQLSTEYSIFAYKVKSTFSQMDIPSLADGVRRLFSPRTVRRSQRKVVQPVLVRENYLTWHWNHKYSIHSYFSVSFVLFALYPP